MKSWQKRMAALVIGGGMLFQFGGSGCTNAFWKGFTNGWPANNRAVNVALDILQEELFG